MPDPSGERPLGAFPGFIAATREHAMNIAIIRNADIHAPAPLGRANILIVNDRIAAISSGVRRVMVMLHRE